LESIRLKKSLKIGVLSEPYYSFPRVCEAIFEEINGEHTDFLVDIRNCLLHGAVTLAEGEDEIPYNLKRIIEELIEDRDVREKIESFNEAKEKLDSGEPFSDFEGRIKQIILEFRWRQNF
jgi:hypothetical protein